MSNTFTAQELADFYQKVADGGEIQTFVRRSSDSKPEWIDSVYGPRPNCLESRYWRIKPTQKVIDGSKTMTELERLQKAVTYDAWSKARLKLSDYLKEHGDEHSI